MQISNEDKIITQFVKVGCKIVQNVEIRVPQSG